MAALHLSTKSAFHPIGTAQPSRKSNKLALKVKIPARPPIVTPEAIRPKIEGKPANPKTAAKTSKVAKDKEITPPSSPQAFSPGRRTPGRTISTKELEPPHRSHYIDALDQHGEALHFGSPEARKITGKERQKIFRAEKTGKPKHTLLPLEYGSPGKTMDRIKKAGGVVVGFDGMIQSPGGTKFKAAKVTDPNTGSQKFILYPTEVNPGAVVVDGSQLGQIFREIDSRGSSCDDILTRISPLSRTPTPPSLDTSSRRASVTQSQPMEVAAPRAPAIKRSRFHELSSPDSGNAAEAPKMRKVVAPKRKDLTAL